MFGGAGGAGLSRNVLVADASAWPWGRSPGSPCQGQRMAAEGRRDGRDGAQLERLGAGGRASWGVGGSRGRAKDVRSKLEIRGGWVGSPGGWWRDIREAVGMRSWVDWAAGECLLCVQLGGWVAGCGRLRRRGVGECGWLVTGWNEKEQGAGGWRRQLGAAAAGEGEGLGRKGLCLFVCLGFRSRRPWPMRRSGPGAGRWTR